MGTTRLERKGRRNIARAKNRVIKIKRLNATPPIKNVDVEAIKKEFEKNAKGKKAENKEEAPKAEAKEAKVAKKKEESSEAEG